MQNYYTLITGATSGIGEEFARQIASLKHNLILVSRSLEKLKEISVELSQKYQIEVHAVELDLSEKEAAEKLFHDCMKKNWRINFLINNAGIGQIGAFQKQDLAEMEQMLNLNIVTLTKITYFFLPEIKKNRGILLNVASQASFQADPYLAVYGATKAFVLSFTEAIQVEHDDETILISALCPGPTHTHFFKRAHSSSKTIRFKFREPHEVVEYTLKKLDKKKTLIIPGFENRFMVFLNRLYPRKFMAKIAQHLVRKK